MSYYPSVVSSTLCSERKIKFRKCQKSGFKIHHHSRMVCTYT